MTSSAYRATGRRFAYKQMHVVRFAEGKCVEHWAVRDDAALMRQLTDAGSSGSARTEGGPSLLP